MTGNTETPPKSTVTLLAELIAERDRLRAALEPLVDLIDRARGYVAEKAQGDVGYGFFPGGDPRNFHPDKESTPEEIESHKKACEAVASGGVYPGPDGEWIGEGDLLIHVTRCKFGLGTYTFADEKAEKLLDKMTEAMRAGEAALTQGGAP